MFLINQYLAIKEEATQGQQSFRIVTRVMLVMLTVKFSKSFAYLYGAFLNV